jgi:hypothetical protein
MSTGMGTSGTHNITQNSSLNIIRVITLRRMIWLGHVAHMREKRNMYKIVVIKPEGKRPLGRFRHRWEETLEWILQKYGE